MTNVVKFPAKAGDTFSQTGFGQAFIYNDRLWISIENSGAFNAIELTTGQGAWFKSSDTVQQVDLEIIVK